ncbi:MAG TPA: dihydroneopterin triphosphate diphosphatase [Oxalicibacterium sp.]|uniref:dihydroneopterin triphosphate diphosphatase n=1 Tax=Oxalicibacterium sp. TaxID=2766525 RepID=UPI002C6FB73C|nr:dihydroneopterin triphosphate diphosphatase [Oxalicibacterium sp.]HWU98963.1 dihydroneopterin triphosphate diphosphatase [Oxalicibacterium sp.]
MTAKPYKIPQSVLVVIHTSDLEVLMIERADRPEFWQSVTGSKDAVDEPWLDTAVREVAEETGITIMPSLPDSGTEPAPSACVSIEHLQDWQLSNVYEIYPVWGYRYAPGVRHNTEHVFGLQVPRDIPVTLSPREHLQYLWLPWREAADKCFSASNAEAILQLPARYGAGRSGFRNVCVSHRTDEVKE